MFRLGAGARHETELHDVAPSPQDPTELDAAVLAVDRLARHTIRLHPTDRRST